MQDFAGQNDLVSSHNRILWFRCNVGMAVVAGIMFIAICAMSTTDVLWPGDSFSDVNVIMSGENFAKYGFIRLRFLPVHNVGPIGDTMGYYLHYPPLPNIINGLLQKAGVHSLFWMRIFCGTFFIIGCVCMYRGLSRVIGPFGAVCGFGFLATTLYFFMFAISLHTHAHNMFFLGMFFLLFLRGIHGEGCMKGTWVGCWAVLFIGSWVSFEFILYTQVFAWIYVMANGQIRRRWWLLVLLGLAPVAGVGLHFLQNCWAVGWSAALADNLGLTKREVSGLVQHFGVMRKVPKVVQERSLRYFYFTWSFISVLAVLVFALRRKISPKMPHRMGCLLLGLLISSSAWYLFLPSHTVRHTHIVNQLLPLVVVVIGCTISIILGVLLRNDSTAWGRILAGSVLLVLVLNQVYMLKPRLIERGRFNNMMILKAIGPNGLPPKAGFLFNRELQVGSYFSYFTRRPAWYPTEGATDRIVSFAIPYSIPGLKSWSNDRLPGPDFLRVLQKCLPEDWPIRYLVFYGKGDYTNNKLFRELAGTCLGEAKKFNIPGKGTPAVLILFDIGTLHLPETERPALDLEVKERQLNGIFPPWDIPGFEQRLNVED